MVPISLSSLELLIFFLNSRWRLPPSWIFRLCELNLAIRVCWQCDICVLCQIGLKYLHWSLRSTHLCFRRSFDDVTRINVRFDFWLCGCLRMAVMHLSIKFGTVIFIQCGVIDILPKLKMAAAAILDLLGEAMGPPTKAHSWCVLPIKFRHDRISRFQVIRVWNFCRSGLKVLFTPQNFSFWKVLPQNLRAHRSDPQKAHPCVISRLLSYRV